MKVRELGRFIRDQRGAARLSLRRLSTLAGISNPYLSQIERGLRRPSAEILQAIAKALRISAETLYVKAGILEERTDTADLGSTIRRDRSLTAKQKQLLLDVYQSFQGRSATRRASVGKVAAAKRPVRKARTASKPNAKATKKTTTRPRAAGKGKAAPKKAARARRTTRRTA